MEINPVVKQRLTEAGVIGGVVDDFNPQMRLEVRYGNKGISLGDQVWAAEVQHRPLDFKVFCDPAHHSDLVEAFGSPTSATVVMTDPDSVGGEYLHWLSMTAFLGPKRPLGLMQWQDLVTYEAPRGRLMGTRKIVFTMFMPVNEYPLNIIIPESRNNFSTRDFASTKALGPPIAAAFFEINYPNENGHHVTAIKAASELDMHVSNKHDMVLEKALDARTYKKHFSWVIVDAFAAEITSDQAEILRSADGVRAASFGRLFVSVQSRIV